jgi:adenine phosphoribosyltransferase
MSTSSLKNEINESFEFVNGHSDVWRLFYNPNLFPRLVDELSSPFAKSGITKVAGIEARGFILGAAVAAHLGVGFVAIRKGAGLYPGPKVELEAPLDYRGKRDILRLQKAAIARGDQILLVDDWFETGSQAVTAKALIENLGGVLVGCSIIVDQLSDSSRDKLGRVESIMDEAELDK